MISGEVELVLYPKMASVPCYVFHTVFDTVFHCISLQL